LKIKVGSCHSAQCTCALLKSKVAEQWKKRRKERTLLLKSHLLNTT